MSGGGRFAGLGIKTGGASGATGWRSWRARVAIAKFAFRRSKVVQEMCSSNAPRNANDVIHTRTGTHSHGRLGWDRMDGCDENM